MKAYSNNLKRTGCNLCVRSGGTFIRAITWAVLIIISSIIVVGFPSAGWGTEDPLTPEERAWLKQHDGKIIVNSEAGWPPIIDTDKDGNSFGIVMDYQRLIEKKLNFKFKLDKLDSWENFMKRFRKGEIDVNNNLQKNPKRTEYALFTKPYIEIPNAIIVRQEIKGSLTLEKMRGMKIAVTKDFAIHDYIKNNYDSLQLLPLDDDLNCLLETSTKNVDAAVVNLAVASFIIEKKGIANLRIAGYAEYTNALCFASRKDWPILNRILDKGLNLITQAERDAIYRKWISLGYIPFYKYRNFWIVSCSVAAAIITIIMMILVWNRSLKRQVQLRTEKLETINIQLKYEIDERKRAEEALRNSEQLLSEMGSMAKIGGWEHDLVTGEAVWTRETYRIVEIESGPIPGPDEHLNYYPTESRVLLDKAYRRAIETGEQFDLKLQCNTAKGRQIWARAIGRPEFKGGKCVKMKGTIQDITEQKRVEDSLQESEEKYRLLVENANDAIFIAQDEVIKFSNPKTTETIGYSEDELPEIPFINLIHPEDREMVIERYLQRLKGEKPPSSYSFRIINKAGDALWVQLNAALITWEKRPATINIIRDITEQRQLENQLRQSQKMESIGTLVGGIAHDFNNILGIILGNTELAIDDVPEWNPARLNLEEVRTASLRARDVVRQLLSFARKTKLEKKPTNIIPIVKESLKLLRSSIPTSIDIRQNIAKDIDTILADPTQINQVLINLCTNADHSMPDGGIIEVTLENVEFDEDSTAQYPELHPGRYVHLIVSDTGHGIPQKNIDNIFDPYFTTKEIGRGTGMGLAVVHGIVKGHNGIITVKSESGKGTTFGLFFPAVEKEAVVEIETDAELPTGNERILFIDDEESIVKLGRQRLEKLGYKVDATTSPLDALDLFRSKPDQFDLVITDLTMPKMTGDKLVKEILNIRPNLPIILCTGFSEKTDESKAKAIGAADYIEKPLDKRDFAFKVRKVLEEAKGDTQG